MIRIPASEGCRLPRIDAELIEQVCRDIWGQVFTMLDSGPYGTEAAGRAAQAAELAAMAVLVNEAQVSLDGIGQG